MYCCEKCEYDTNDRSNYLKHRRTKRHISNYPLDTLFSACSEHTQPTGITLEPFVHDGTPQHATEVKICGFCSTKFTRNSSLVRHMKVCPEKESSKKIMELEEKIKFKETIYKKTLRDKNKQIKDKEKYIEKLLSNLSKTGNKTINNANYIMINYSEAPPIMPIDVSKIGILKYSPENVSNLLIHCYNGTLNKLLTNAIVDNYKKEDPTQQSIWATDTSRNNYIIREKNKNGEIKWIIDKCGKKVIEYTITPMLSTLLINVNKFVSEIPIIPIQTNKYDIYMSKSIFLMKNIKTNVLHRTLASSLSSFIFHNKINL